jgi:[ribosomal protein S18]-alanine N-acetyltransferase
MALEFRPLDEVSARAVLAWRYEPPYDVYDTAPDDAVALGVLLDPANGYHAVRDHGELVAYCCFGPDARVPGGDYSPDAMDLGVGVRPDIVGRGRGLDFLSAVLAFAAEAVGPRSLRATVAAFNARALRVCERGGFRRTGGFRRPLDGAEFVILVRGVSS